MNPLLFSDKSDDKVGSQVEEQEEEKQAKGGAHRKQGTTVSATMAVGAEQPAAMLQYMPKKNLFPRKQGDQLEVFAELDEELSDEPVPISKRVSLQSKASASPQKGRD